MIKNIYKGNCRQGENFIVADFSEFVNGTYFIELVTPTSKINKKIVIIH
jgi:hypothetical protein